MLTAVNSPADRFDDRSLRSWISAPRGRHSEKPAEVRQLIERASPGPRIKLFATSAEPGWVSWGGAIHPRQVTQRLSRRNARSAGDEADDLDQVAPG
jgi:N6-adenosine-specific RNA methylase IME4